MMNAIIMCEAHNLSLCDFIRDRKPYFVRLKLSRLTEVLRKIDSPTNNSAWA